MQAAFRVEKRKPTELTETSFPVNPLIVFEDTESAQSMLHQFFLGNEEELNHLRSRWLPYLWHLKFARGMHRAIKQVEVLRPAYWKALGVAAFTRDFYETARRVRNCDILIEKSPNSVFVMPELLSSFPNSQLIYIWRDAPAVLASYRKRYEREKDSGKSDEELRWLQVDLNGLGRRLRKNYKRILSVARRHPENMCILEYDEFCEKPEQYLAAILKRLGIEDETLELPSEENATWESDPKLTQRISKADSGFSSFVTETEALILQNAVRQEVQNLKTLGLSV